MSGAKQQKDSNPLSTVSPSVPAMIGNRVRKRRAPGANDGPAKRAKIAAPSAPPKAQTPTRAVTFAATLSSSLPAATSAPASVSASIPVKQPKTKRPTKSPRQLRLTEMLKRDRAQRLRDTAPEPSIVLGAPHMDSRRPKPRSASSSVSSKSQVTTDSTPSTPRRRALGKSDLDAKLLSLLSSPVTRHAVTPETSLQAAAPQQVLDRKEETSKEFNLSTAGLASTRVRCAGTEAITYSRSMLPKDHCLLLDIFAGIETAVNLLRTRQEPSTFGNVRDIVAQSSKRNFTFRHLSQLAHLVPEAICVLPAKNPRQKTRDHLILRLDNVKLNSTAQVPSKSSMVSFVGGAATRGRRQLLHNRLLEHVREQHRKFLEAQGIKNFESNIWHEDFNLESDVGELGAPPLYPVAVPRLEKKEQLKKQHETEKRAEPEDETPKTVVLGSVSKRESEAEADACIPSSLLQLVRARSKARIELKTAKDDDYQRRPDYLARLPATMDTIASILRNERRQAMGWKNLLERVKKDHPRQWSAEEVERQMESIVEMASGWCTKIKLTGPKLRYAFRMIDERKFAAERAKVVAAQNQT